MNIVKNEVKCKNCGEVIISEFNGNKISCSCGNIIIDGGTERLIREGTNFEERSKFLITD